MGRDSLFRFLGGGGGVLEKGAVGEVMHVESRDANMSYICPARDTNKRRPLSQHQLKF